MFQTFETSADPTLAKPRVTALRAELARRGLDATILPRADEHQGEYVPTCAERLHWLTGFSGSAGFAAVTAKAAAVFVDGRYTVQAKAEVDTKLFEIEPLKPGALAGWLADNLADGAVVGFDPALWTIRQVEDLERALEPKGIKLRAVRTNLVDRIWGKDRPPAPMAPVRLQPVERSGREAADKIAGIQSELDKDGHDACVLTLPDSISWLFNIRGADVAHNPVVLAFAILHRRARPELFIAPEKLDKETRAALKQVARLKKPADLDESLKALREAGKRVRLDPATAAFRFLRALGARNVARASDPCILPKARKNETEIAGARRAHVRDGAAVVRFLAWLDEAAGSGEALDEITAVRRLEAFRAETGELAEISFDTISGSGPNGAIVHYRVNETTNRALGPGELFLIDSGAQYVDGTTDITRTVAIGAPAPGMIRDTTLVLKGHIAIATALFPKGTRGIDLDPFARRALWAAGLDYDHGTGHGVGSYLSVHEGPASISRAGMVPLEPGMILSNEPGLYREGQYGIRLENLVLVVDRSQDVTGDRETFGFETLTLAPFDRRLIDKSLLSPEELGWLDAYHAKVRDTLLPELADKSAKTWLKSACAPL